MASLTQITAKRERFACEIMLRLCPQKNGGGGDWANTLPSFFRILSTDAFLSHFNAEFLL